MALWDNNSSLVNEGYQSTGPLVHSVINMCPYLFSQDEAVKLYEMSLMSQWWSLLTSDSELLLSSVSETSFEVDLMLLDTYQINYHTFCVT